MTWREIVYYTLDSIKAISNDATVVEEHVIFLANQYRVYLLDALQQQGIKRVSTSDYQTICLNLEETETLPDGTCDSETILRSKEEVPTVISPELTNVYPYNYFGNIRITYVTKERFRAVGYNRFMRNIIYCTTGPDNHLYFKGANPQFEYLEQAKMTSVFEDADKAAELSCEVNDGSCTDKLDTQFPMEAKLIPQMIELLTKELLGFYYRPKESENDDADNIADLVSWARKNMKSDVAKQITEV